MDINNYSFINYADRSETKHIIINYLLLVILTITNITILIPGFLKSPNLVPIVYFTKICVAPEIS